MQKLLDSIRSSNACEPEIFSLTKSDHCDKLTKLIQLGEIRHSSDDYEEQLRELYAINNPSHVFLPEFKREQEAFLHDATSQTPLWQQGMWVYYPWRSLITHVLPEDDFIRVRTTRNRNLIDENEQKTFYDSTVGIGGLSVGSSIAFALALSGGPKHMKLADMDRLALSNTNRVLAGTEALGVSKVVMAARRLYEINPYLHIELFDEGINEENIGAFFENLDICIDELDNIAVKYLIRREAKKRKIPVVMGADNGDNAVIDVERYDIDPSLEYFHGRLGEVTYEELQKLDKFGIGRTIARHIGPENVTVPMQESLLEMGKSIVSWPQLGNAALLNGAAIAYSVRKILNGQELESNRGFISLDASLQPTYDSESERSKRQSAADAFRKVFKL